jgi:hypothetical protein
VRAKPLSNRSVAIGSRGHENPQPKLLQQVFVSRSIRNFLIAASRPAARHQELAAKRRVLRTRRLRDYVFAADAPSTGDHRRDAVAYFSAKLREVEWLRTTSPGIAHGTLSRPRCEETPSTYGISLQRLMNSTMQGISLTHAGISFRAVNRRLDRASRHGKHVAT